MPSDLGFLQISTNAKIKVFIKLKLPLMKSSQ